MKHKKNWSFFLWIVEKFFICSLLKLQELTYSLEQSQTKEWKALNFHITYFIDKKNFWMGKFWSLIEKLGSINFIKISMIIHKIFTQIENTTVTLINEDIFFSKRANNEQKFVFIIDMCACEKRKICRWFLYSSSYFLQSVFHSLSKYSRKKFESVCWLDDFFLLPAESGCTWEYMWEWKMFFTSMENECEHKFPRKTV